MSELTVVITTYNLEKYIGKCLEELFNQTFQGFDVVVFDDCSSDNTRSIVNAHAQKHTDRIKCLFSNVNYGSPARARNAVLQSGEIRGKYVIFLDGDDTIEPTFFEKMFNEALENNGDIVVCAYDRREDGTGHVLCEEMRGYPKIIEMSDVNDTLAFMNGAVWNKMFLTEKVEGVLFPEISVGEDLIFAFNVLKKCKRILFIDECLVHYRVHSASAMANISINAINELASEFTSLKKKESNGVLKDTVGLMAFIHVGLSMTIRAANNSEIDLRQLLKWMRGYFRDNFLWFNGNKFFKLGSLCRHGKRGVAVFITKFMYRIGCYKLFLSIYSFMVKVLKRDVKF